MLCLGIDSGTTSCKGLVLDAESGKVLASARAPHSFIEGLAPGSVEQDPHIWIDAADTVLNSCLEKLGHQRNDIVAIGISAQQHGLVTLDDQNEPVRPAKLWCDTSTNEQAQALNRVFGNSEELIRRTGNLMVTGYTAPKLLWLKEEEPDNFEHTRTVCLPHDYLNFWLTGERQMEYGDASGTGLLDVRTRNWCEPLAEFIDPGLLAKFPPLRSSARPAGLLRAKFGEKWGIGDALVSAGSGDNMMGAIGTGNVEPGILTLSLGASGTVSAFAETPLIDPRGEVSIFCDSTDHWLPLVCTMNVADVVERVRALFGWDMHDLEKAVAGTKPGASGLVFLPYLQGERLPNLPNGVGVLHGLNLKNTDPAEIARAMIEGIIIVLANGWKRMRELGISATELRLTGGGARSAVTRQIVADIFGMPVTGFRIWEGAALGAAIHAAWTYCAVKGNALSLQTLVKSAVKVERKSRAEPRKERVSLYAELRGRHADLTRKLATGGYL